MPNRAPRPLSSSRVRSDSRSRQAATAAYRRREAAEYRLRTSRFNSSADRGTRISHMNTSSVLNPALEDCQVGGRRQLGKLSQPLETRVGEHQRDIRGRDPISHFTWRRHFSPTFPEGAITQPEPASPPRVLARSRRAECGRCDPADDDAAPTPAPHPDQARTLERTRLATGQADPAAPQRLHFRERLLHGFAGLISPRRCAATSRAAPAMRFPSAVLVADRTA